MRKRALPSTAQRIHIGTLDSCRSGDSRFGLCLYLFAVPDTHSLIAIDNEHAGRLADRQQLRPGCTLFVFHFHSLRQAVTDSIESLMSRWSQKCAGQQERLLVNHVHYGSRRGIHLGN